MRVTAQVQGLIGFVLLAAVLTLAVTPAAAAAVTDPLLTTWVPATAYGFMMITVFSQLQKK